MKTKCMIGLTALALVALLSPVQAADESKLTSKDTTFITNASEGGVAEIQASKMAEKTSSNADVKEFARMMIKDHGKAGAELGKIATAQGGKPSDSPSVMQKASLALLDTKKGDSFDKSYAEMMVKDHREVVDMFQKASTDLDNPELKEFATKTLPTLKHHLAAAEKLAGKFGK